MAASWSFHTRLPESLQELHIEVGSDFYWRDWEEDEPQGEPHLYARELVALLSGLAEAKAKCFPELQELHVWHEDYGDGLPPNVQLLYFPLVCDHTRNFVALLEGSHINVFFSGISGVTVIESDEFLDS